MMEIEILTQRKSEECGCPEEEIQIGLCCFIIHLEENGSGHLFLDMGDYDDEKLVECNGTIEDLRLKAHEWAEEIHQKKMELY